MTRGPTPPPQGSTSRGWPSEMTRRLRVIIAAATPTQLLAGKTERLGAGAQLRLEPPVTTGHTVPAAFVTSPVFQHGGRYYSSS